MLLLGAPPQLVSPSPHPKPNLPPRQVICWVLGEYGRLASRCGVGGVMDRLAAIPETQTADDEVGRAGSTARLEAAARPARQHALTKPRLRHPRAQTGVCS